MQKTILKISKGVGLLQLSWVQRERGMALLALSNSISPTSQWGRGFIWKSQGSGRASIYFSGSFCGMSVPGQGWDCVVAQHWDEAAQHRLEQPQSALATPSPLLAQRAAPSNTLCLNQPPAFVLSPIFPGFGLGRGR